MRINFLYVNIKKKNNKILAFKLKANGKIITLKKPFETSDLKKLNALFKKGILRPEIYNTVHLNITVFKLKIIRKIKSKNILLLYEKLRLII